MYREIFDMYNMYTYICCTYKKKYFKYEKNQELRHCPKNRVLHYSCISHYQSN